MSVRYVIASNNPHKREEMQRILSSLDIEVVTAQEAGFSPIDPVEDGETFEENARIKAEYFRDLCAMPAIADDSGLCVDYLGGAPGVYTARYAGEGCTSDDNIDKLLSVLGELPLRERTARFVSCICVACPDGSYIEARGKCEGYIGFERCGEGGFGYDPIFCLHDGRCFGTMSAKEKDEVSHRGAAMEKLRVLLAEQKNPV